MNEPIVSSLSVNIPTKKILSPLQTEGDLN
jgi:hypothetical protein